MLPNLDTSSSTDPALPLRGKTAVVTGASRGIGEAMVQRLLRGGCSVIGVSSGPPASSVTGVASPQGVTYEHVAVDLMDRQALSELCERLVGTQIDILVNNAGIIRRAAALEHLDEDWDSVIELDLRAPFALAREIAQGMVARGYGRIVFTASVLSFQGGVAVPSYAAAKHGVVGLVRALSNEWAVHGVTVNGVVPGYIETEATEALRADPVRQAAIVDRIPAGRWGKPEDIAGAVAFLVGPEAGYVTGSVIVVDGGWLAR